MRFSSKLLEEAVQAFNSLPGVGKKSALRMALHLLKKDTDYARKIANAMIRGYINWPLICGILNRPGIFSFLGINNTPPQTKTKANKVAMLVKSRTKLLSVKSIGTPTIKPVTIVAKEGVLNFS